MLKFNRFTVFREIRLALLLQLLIILRLLINKRFKLKKRSIVLILNKRILDLLIFEINIFYFKSKVVNSVIQMLFNSRMQHFNSKIVIHKLNAK